MDMVARSCHNPVKPRSRPSANLHCSKDGDLPSRKEAHAPDSQCGTRHAPLSRRTVFKTCVSRLSQTLPKRVSKKFPENQGLFGIFGGPRSWL
ncbi:hypothetical protein AAFF_G00369430 [Aldrovandia affinis]|uniref:Uncharacterized protein n=1 Tax=Aldrovandia affinis TaxID=143900 RepID=A0AAD7SH19_9TELE|nr:hypothetical protein AAFF_G00369430 [Aldrovandia affinis]